MKKGGKGSSVTIWAAVALGAVGIGVVLAFLAGYFLGHFTGHENTTTVSLVPASSASSEAGSPPTSGEGEEAGEGEGEEEAPPKKEASTPKNEASAGNEASLTAGKTAFTTNCASCHTLSEAGTTGTVGPNLDELMPSQALVEKQVTNGGTVMPAFGETLSGKEIEEIAEYVSTVAGTGNDSLGGKSTG